MHGRIRIAIDPRVLYAGTEHVGFSPTRQALLAPSVKRREVFVEEPTNSERTADADGRRSQW